MNTGQLPIICESCIEMAGCKLIGGTLFFDLHGFNESEPKTKYTCYVCNKSDVLVVHMAKLRIADNE